MSKVLFLNPYYYPGFRSGGPQRTVMNIADAFGDTNDIYILTQNRDMGCSESYDVETHKWIRVGKANVMYLPPKEYNIRFIKKYSRDFEKIYSCGFFCRCTINALLLHKFNPTQKLYVAPMGVFSEAAIASKALKKYLFLFAFKHCGMFKNVVWSFTSEMELAEAKKVMGDAVKDYIIAEDLPREVDFTVQFRKKVEQEKHRHEPLKLIFLSRISPKKNLEFCAEVLNQVKGTEVCFDVYGMAENLEYWDKCRRKLEHLPSNVHYCYCGEVNASDVIQIFSKYDVFLFPTKGENFGHVIYEALAAGCVPIISDQTPWQDLEENECGVVVSIGNAEGFSTAIQKFSAYKSLGKLSELAENAIQYARDKRERAIQDSGYLRLFCNGNELRDGKYGN